MDSISRDPGLGLGHFSHRVWVACPQCGKAALATSPALGEARLSCASCGHQSKDPQGARLSARIGVLRTHCHNCGRRYPLTIRRARRFGRALQAPIRCLGCGHVTRQQLRPADFGSKDGLDPWFGLPLFLSELVGRDTLWVYNAAHLTALEDYLGATLRKRARPPYQMTMMARLPRWMKAKAGRHRVLRSLARLRRRALAAGIA